MKVLLFTFFLAAATAIPVPDDDSGPVDVIVNGVAEGQPLEIGDIVDIKVKEHVDGHVVAATNVLHPFTAEGLAEAAAAAEPQPPAAVELPELIAPEVIPDPVILPEPVAPEVIVPDPVVLPEPAAPEVIVPGPVVIPEPPAPEVIVPGPVVIPEPVAPEVVPEPAVPEGSPGFMPLPEVVGPEVVIDPGTPEAEFVPAPAAQLPSGEIFNDGLVSVALNAPEEPGVMATLQSWFNMVMNYVTSNGATTTQQII